MIVLRDRPALWWLLALMFIGVGGGFVYLGVARAFEVPWWQAALFAGMGIAAVGTGVHVAWGSPLSTIVIDVKAQELRLVQTGIFGRRVRHFPFRDIDKVVVERRRDDDGAMMARPAIELKDGQSVSLSSLWRHDTAGITRVIKTLRPSVIPNPEEATAEKPKEPEGTAKMPEVAEEMPEAKEERPEAREERPQITEGAPGPAWFEDEVEEVVPVAPVVVAAPAKPAWYVEEIEPAGPVDEIEIVATVPEPVGVVVAPPGTIDPFEPADPHEVIERVEPAEAVHAFAALEIPDPFAPEPAELPAPPEIAAPVSNVWAAALSDVEPERAGDPIDVSPPSDAFAAYAAEREASGLQLVEAGGLRLVEGSPFRPFLRRARDAGWIVEACLSNRVRCALLYAVNLTPKFFDLSSGEAGEILQKLRNYHVRLAVVRTPESAPMSSRFGEMVEEERRGPHFAVFDTRAEAEHWLRRVEAGGTWRTL